MADKNEMTMLSIPRTEQERLKQLAKRDNRTMRALFKLMVDMYEQKLDKEGK